MKTFKPLQPFTKSTGITGHLHKITGQAKIHETQDMLKVQQLPNSCIRNMQRHLHCFHTSYTKLHI